MINACHLQPLLAGLQLFCFYSENFCSQYLCSVVELLLSLLFLIGLCSVISIYVNYFFLFSGLNRLNLWIVGIS